MAASRINWDNLFGLSADPQRPRIHKQDNVVSSEALADEMDTEHKPDSSVTSAPSDEETSDGNAPEKTEGSEDPAEKPSDTDGADASEEPEASDPGEDPAGDAGDDPGADPSGGDGADAGSPAATPDPTADAQDSTTPSGVNPNRSLNGKIRLSQEIRNLIGEMESALETFEQISLKNPVVVKLRELKDATELLLDTVASVPVEDTMVRYEITVRNFSELVKSLKNRKQ